MKKIAAILILMILTYPSKLILGQSQYISKAKSWIQSKQPGATLEKNYERTKPYGLTHYYEYGFKFRKKDPLPGYPNAIATGTQYCSFWANGSKKEIWNANKGYYEGIPDPNISSLNQAIESINLNDFNDLLKIGIADQQMAENLVSVEEISLGTNMKYDWVNEKEVIAGSGLLTSVKEGSGYVIYTYINGGRSTAKYKAASRLIFKRDAYNQPWELSRVVISPNNEKLEEKEYSTDEMVKIENSTFGAVLAEEIAKKDWESLPNIEIPEFKTIEEFLFFSREFLLTKSEEEVKAFFYHTAPSYKYHDGSQYRLDLSYLQYVEYAMKEIFNEGNKSFRKEYCVDGAIRGLDKSSLTVFNKNQTASTKFTAEKDNDGKFKLSEVKFYFSDESKGEQPAHNLECKTLETKKYELEGMNCSFNFPEKPEEIQLPPSQYKGKKFSYVGFDFIFGVRSIKFNNSPDSYDEESRFENAKSNAEFHIEESMWNAKTTTKEFTLNGQRGYEIFAKGDNRGGRGGPWGSYQEIVRYIMFENVIYEYYIKGPYLSESMIGLIETFNSTLKGSTTSSSSNNVVEETTNNTEEKETVQTSYNVGDAVLVRVSQTEWKPGYVREDKGGGKYRVELTNKKQYIQPYKNLKLDPTRKPESSSTSSTITTKDSYEVKDQVLVNTKQGYKEAVVTKIVADKYEVYCPSTNSYFTATKGALKSNPGGKAKEKKKLPNIKLR